MLIHFLCHYIVEKNLGHLDILYNTILAHIADIM